MNELDIIKECKKGKLDNFTIIYENYFHEIYKFIFFKTLKKEITEDLTSQTFFKALNKIKSFDTEKSSNFKSWLYKIALNLTIDNYKKFENDISIDEVIEMGYSEDFGKNLDNKNKLKELFKFFDTLKPDTKQILVMRIWEGLSYKEISEITGRNINNCKKIYSRTILKIKEENVNLFIIIIFILIGL